MFLIAGFDGDCKPLATTAITIERHPSKGIVTLQPVLETAIQYSLSGKCVGSKVPGTGVYYTARTDAVGPDTFTIAARNGKGAMATQNITVNIAE